MPTKKERGKLRKASKKLAADNNGGVNVIELLAKVRKGDNKTTLAILAAKDSSVLFNKQSSALVSIALKFLRRCESDTFAEVMLDVGGGDLICPSIWLKILFRAIELEPREEHASGRRQIVQSIGPLIRCMCNDTARLFFKSNMHWRDTIRSFVGFIHNMIHILVNSDGSKGLDILEILLNYEGLLTTITQWSFWKEDHRPDISNELVDIEGNKEIPHWGRKATWKVITAACKLDAEDKRKRLDNIANTPILNKSYESTCQVSFVIGLVRIMKTDRMVGDFTALRTLLKESNCVSKDLITELFDLGLNFTPNLDDAKDIASTFSALMLRGIGDNRIAFLIRCGMFEMCLAFIERFGDESCEKETQQLVFDFIEVALSDISKLAFHRKTWKAIEAKASTIEENLAAVEQKPDITNNVKCRELTDMIRCILNINGSYCCRCNKSLDRSDMKHCNGCNTMTYCSETCQREDWLNGGHKLTCNKPYSCEIIGVFQGNVSETETGEVDTKELETNISMIQLKLFLDNADNILSQASVLTIPLSDCVVGFDLRQCPYAVVVMACTECCETPEMATAFDKRSRENITCLYLTGIWSIGESEGLPLGMQRFFPHEWLKKQRIDVRVLPKLITSLPPK